MWMVFLALTGFLSFSAFQTLDVYHADQAYTPGVKWEKIAHPSLMGWDKELLEQAKAYADKIGSTAVVIVENGVVVEAWGKYNEKINIKSVRKSLLSGVYGVFIAQGDIRLGDSLESLGIDDIHPLTKSEKQALVIDLMRSRSGVYHPAAYETSKMKALRPIRGRYPTGSHYYYNNWDFNVLLTIFEKRTKTSFKEALMSVLAKPLQFEHFQQQDIRYVYEEKKSRHPAYVIKMSALDLARFGLLFLRSGKWQGKQILPESWVFQSTSPYTVFSRSRKYGYGLMWFTGENFYFSSGNRGQKLVIFPSRKLIIVHLVKKGRVPSSEFWKLQNLILKASEKKKTASKTRQHPSGHVRIGAR